MFRPLPAFFFGKRIGDPVSPLAGAVRSYAC